MQPSSPTRRSAALRALPAHASHGFAKAPLALAAQVLIAASSIAMLGWAPQATAQTAPQSAAPAVRAYSIPAGPLSTVLTRLSVEGGLRLAGASAEAQDVQSPGVQGRHSASSALAAALAGTNVEAVPQGDGSYLLRQIATLPEVRVTAPSSGVATLPEVVVTANAYAPRLTEGSDSYTTESTSAATGMNISLRETPQSVSVMTRHRIDQQSLTSVGDIAEQTVGLTLHRHGSQVGGTTSLWSRGYEITSYQVDGVSSRPNNSSYFGITSLDSAIYDSVAVVRGAPGLLNGSGDPSGSLHLTRKRATDTFQASLEGGLGSWKTRRGVMDVAGPLNKSGSLRGRLVTAHEQGDSWVDRYQGKNSLAYGTLEVDITPYTLFTASAEIGRKKADDFMWNGAPLLYTDGSRTPFGRSSNTAPNWAYMKDQRHSQTFSLEHQFNSDWSAKITYGRSQQDLDHNWGVAVGFLPNGLGYGRLVRSDIEEQQDALDIRINGQYQLFGRMHEVMLGANGSSVETSFGPPYYSGLQTPVQIIDGAIHYSDGNWWETLSVTGTSNTRKTKQHGIFISTRLRPTDYLSLVIGGRWSNWRTENNNTINGVLLDDRKENGVFTPYAGIVYDLTKNISAYASYTEIFNPQNYRDIEGRVLDPQKGKNYELGFKGEWYDGRLNASIAAFRSGKDNLAIADGTNAAPDGSQAYVAHSNTKVRGWELEVAGELSRGWSLQGGFSKSTLKDSAGIRIQNDLPARQLKIFSAYNIDSLPGLTVGGGVTWQSKTHNDWAPNLVQSSYALANLMVQYEINRNATISANLNNVFDKEYLTRPDNHLYGSPRSFHVSAKYRF